MGTARGDHLPFSEKLITGSTFPIPMNRRVILLALVIAPAGGLVHADLKAPATRPDTPVTTAPPAPRAIPIADDDASTSPSGTELPPTLAAATLLEPELLQGPAHRVRASVPTDGYMAHFTIDSDFGTFRCAGVDQARQRIHEVGAISRLVSESKGDLFAEAVKKSIEQPVDAVKNIVKDPVGTVTQAPKTVGHFFRRLGSSIKAGAEQVASNASGKSEDTPGPRASTGESLAAAGRGVIGFDKAKLDCARQLGVDPYSDNPVLQEQLEKVSWVYFAGGLPLRVGAAAASGGASLALTSTKMIGLPDEVYSLTPAELALRNRQSLDTLGVPEAVQTDFMGNVMLTPTLKRSILRSLERLAPATGRDTMVELSSRCETLEQAQFLDRSLRLLADRQHTGQARYTQVVALGRVPAAVEAGGGLEVAAVVDSISWTDEVADFARRDDLRTTKPTLILTGEASELAIIGFKEAGWKLARP
jgi:hypothetical protein